MNTTGYVKTLRPFMDAEELVALYGSIRPTRPVGDILEELAAAGVRMFDIGDEEEKVGTYHDASVIAADLSQPLRVRRLAATVARCAEAAIEQGMCSFDLALDWMIASEKFHIEVAEEAAKGAHR